MAFLNDIWDEPAESVVRQPQQLFLDGSDDEHDASKPQDKRMQGATDNDNDMDVDVDALFADIDDDEFDFKPLGPSLDKKALEKEAEARHRNNLPPLTSHAVTASLPTGLDGTAGEKGKEKEEKKKRRRPIVLDEGRLLGPDGFPRLIKEVKSFRTKGKGHELDDLDRLLRVYGYWSHALYPKTTFRDTVERIEKLCHSKRMNVALSVWRDEFHGRNNKEERDDDSGEDLPIPKEEEPSKQDRPASSSPSPNAVSSPSRPPSLPPSSATEPDDDEFDIDAIIREEEERLAKKRAQSDEAGTGPDKSAQRRGRPIIVDDGDEGMWDDIHGQPSSAMADVRGDPPQNEDEDMWDIVKEIEAEAHAPPTTEHIADAKDEEDDYEWMYN